MRRRVVNNTIHAARQERGRERDPRTVVTVLGGWSSRAERRSGGSVSTSAPNSHSSDDEDESKEEEDDSDYDLLEDFRLGIPLVKDSNSSVMDESNRNVDEVHVHSLQNTTWKEVFNVVSSKYYDDTLSADGNVAISNGNQIGAELVHTAASVANSTVQSEPLFRWM